jgi:hypothetical protein
MDMVIKGEADVGVGDFTMSKERSEMVAFTNSLGSER